MRRYGYKVILGVLLGALLGAQFASATKKVIAIGVTQIGKGTLLNCVVDVETEIPFLALNSTKGVTQGFRSLKSTILGVEVIDSPGFSNQFIEIPEWTHKYNKYLESNPEMRDESLMVIMIIGAETRVRKNEKILVALANEAFKAIKPENMVLVVNKAP